MSRLEFMHQINLNFNFWSFITENFKQAARATRCLKNGTLERSNIGIFVNNLIEISSEDPFSVRQSFKRTTFIRIESNLHINNENEVAGMFESRDF